MNFASAFDTPPPLADGGAEFEISTFGLKHIPDAQDRRFFEGWASLVGVDWQDEEITPDAFRAGAAEYLQKNPVILWDHKKDDVIGKVHTLTFAPEGLYMKGEIMRLPVSPHHRPGMKSLAVLCDDVWASILAGTARGLSVRGTARSRQVQYDQASGRVIKRTLEVLLVEISVTPIQVHPGAKIVAANTVAKALEIAKALPVRKELQMTLKEAQAKYLQAMREEAEKNGGALPDDIAEAHLKVAQAIKPASPATSSSEDVIKSLQSQIDELKSKLQVPAPSKKIETLHADPKSQPRSPDDSQATLQKALHVLSDPHLRVKYGLPDISVADAATLVFAQGGSRGTISSESPWRNVPSGLTASPGLQEALRQFQRKMEKGEIA